MARNPEDFASREVKAEIRRLDTAATPGSAELLAANMQASIEVGPLQCSQGGHPYNGDHIEYWKNRALKADERRLAAKPAEEVRDVRKIVLKTYGFSDEAIASDWIKRSHAYSIATQVAAALSTTGAPKP